MPQNKKHHYVPRFYLKRFSDDDKSINIWNIPSSKKILSARLKNQCYKDYFYGKDPDSEKRIGHMEQLTAEVFRMIDHIGFPPPMGTKEYLILMLFILMQYGRTTHATETLDEMTNDFMQHVLAPKAESEGIDLSQVKIGLKDSALYSMNIHVNSLPLAIDLMPKLLINKTGIDFVSSDNPVVLYNQLLSFRSFTSNAAIPAKGLQIFLPISPTQQLIFYDHECYSVGSHKSDVINITEAKDVYELNTLQMCSANENVYFSNHEMDIVSLCRKSKPFMRRYKTKFNVYPGKTTDSHKHEFIMTTREDIRTELKLSFVGITRKTKIWRTKFRKMNSQPAVVVRNEELTEAHRDFTKRVVANEYAPHEFFKYLDERISNE